MYACLVRAIQQPLAARRILFIVIVMTRDSQIPDFLPGRESGGNLLFPSEIGREIGIFLIDVRAKITYEHIIFILIYANIELADFSSKKLIEMRKAKKEPC